MREKESEIEITADYIRRIVNVMKERFGKETIVLFHVEDNYECFLEDSTLVAEVLGIKPELYFNEENSIYVTRFPAGELVNYRGRLTDEGLATCTNETLSADGKHHILKIYEPEK